MKSKLISISISPPFWRSTWFILLLLLVISSIVYFVYRYRVGQINQRANLDKMLAQTEMKALHSQMNPHFVFNCLNSIKKMILDNENQKASRYLSKFAQMIRDTLNQSTKPYISLRHTIDHLQRYLEMEQIRSTHFTYSIDTDPSIDPEDIFIPPMLIQPIIENAIWHGTETEKGTIHINIRFSQKNDQLLCEIEDNGIGIENSLKQKTGNLMHHSLGIGNIRQRIQVLNEKYNLKSSISIIDRVTQGESGTLASIYLPIKNSES